MIKKILTKIRPVVALSVISLGIGASLALSSGLAPSVGAVDPGAEIRGGVTASGGDAKGPGLDTSLKSIVNVLLFILGAIAVIMIVIGGIRYATSNGDASQVTSAKNTILYAVVGLVVAMLAYAIVNFVIDAFAPKKESYIPSTIEISRLS